MTMWSKLFTLAACLVKHLMLLTAIVGSVAKADETKFQLNSNRPPCSLNGLVRNNACVCHPPWHGPDCSTMRFLPVSFPQGYGMAPNLTTWGGGVLFDGSQYHLYVSAMTNGCSLRDWTKNSRIDHAVSDKINGPYKFKSVAINTWSHNPAPVALSDGSFAIIHIGNGSGERDGGKNCSSNDGMSSVAKRGLFRASAGSTIHVSQSLNGPWKPLAKNTLGSCNNPAPAVHPRNGTIYILCGQSLKGSASISGPWRQVSKVQLSGGPKGKYEDPFLYIDKNGAFHLLYHVYNTTEHPPHGHECVDSTVSAHAYSADGREWFMSSTQPYGTQIVLDSGESITVATRERPKLFFDQSGQMTHLINGVCSAPNCPNGPKEGCVDCKYDWWDYTLFAPLDVGSV